jgi:hypothetical protein
MRLRPLTHLVILLSSILLPLTMGSAVTVHRESALQTRQATNSTLDMARGTIHHVLAQSLIALGGAKEAASHLQVLWPWQYLWSNASNTSWTHEADLKRSFWTILSVCTATSRDRHLCVWLQFPDGDDIC